MTPNIISSKHTTTKGFIADDGHTIVHICAFNDSIHMTLSTGKQQTRISVSREESRRIGCLLIEAADAAANASEKEAA